MSNILEIAGVDKYYNSLAVLKGINLSLQEGEVVSLLGPSGCGKTTLFRMIAGLTAPRRGEISLDSGTRVGYVFQEPRLLPWKTAAGNLRFVQQNFLCEKEAHLLREELLFSAGLERFKDHFPGELSGGMRQRLELIRALAIRPELLLLDEPFKSLDTYLRVSLREMLLTYWQRERLGIFMITHDPEEAVLISDRILVLSRRPGRVIREFRLRRARAERSLRDEQVYAALEEILTLLRLEAEEAGNSPRKAGEQL